ncbi:hypothetical protein PISMIDRAFT_677799, partial [Pisolithus microcarpus 441]
MHGRGREPKRSCAPAAHSTSRESVIYRLSLGSLMIRVAPHIRSLTPPIEDHANNFVDEAGNCLKTNAL